MRPGKNADRDDDLDDRWLYPADWPKWTADERAAIEKAAAAFEPEWKLDRSEFSVWHYFVLSHQTNEKAYHYKHPVVVLMDGECFSATDIFLGALKGRAGVCLIGTPSGGGSGRALPVELRNSRITVMLSSMASFRPNGKLYDSRGIEPDLVVEPTLDDVLGKTDSQLARALAEIKRNASP